MYEPTTLEIIPSPIMCSTALAQSLANNTSAKLKMNSAEALAIGFLHAVHENECMIMRKIIDKKYVYEYNKYCVCFLVWTICICMQIGDQALTAIEMLAKADYDYGLPRQLPQWSFRDTTRVRFSLYSRNSCALHAEANFHAVSDQLFNKSDPTGAGAVLRVFWSHNALRRLLVATSSLRPLCDVRSLLRPAKSTYLHD